MKTERNVMKTTNPTTQKLYLSFIFFYVLYNMYIIGLLLKIVPAFPPFINTDHFSGSTSLFIASSIGWD
jgi:hypothetical protein